MFWLYLHFPSLLLDHYARTQNQTPLALLRGTPPVVEQASASARDQGVRPGQSLTTARSLCPELLPCHSDEKRQQRELTTLAAWLYPLASPLVLWPPDGIAIRAGELKRLYGSLDALCQALTDAIEQRELHYRMAAGSTPRMARLLARHSHAPCTDSETDSHQALSALPVSATDWPRKVCERLQRMGLTHLGQVLQCCPRELAHRLGPELVRDLQLLRGQRLEPCTEFVPPQRFRQRLELVQEASHAGALRFPLQRLLQDLETFLRYRQQTTDHLELILLHPDSQHTQLPIRLSRPRHQATDMAELIHLQLERQQLKDTVHTLELRTRRLMTLHARADDLFQSPESEAEALEGLVSRLTAKLGEDQLLRTAPRDDHRPEHAHHLSPRHQSNEASRHWLMRPLWLQQPPQPLTVTPQAWLNGPERLQGGWWDGDYVRRDYYIARLESGRRAWLFRNAEGQWFIHGWFG